MCVCVCVSHLTHNCARLPTQERLGFDNEIAALEKAIKKRRKDLQELESMYNDAQHSRDMAKVSSSPLSMKYMMIERLK